MQLYVKMLTGQTFTLEVDPRKDTILSVKQQINKQEGGPKVSR